MYAHVATLTRPSGLVGGYDSVD